MRQPKLTPKYYGRPSIYLKTKDIVEEEEPWQMMLADMLSVFSRWMLIDGGMQPKKPNDVYSYLHKKHGVVIPRKGRFNTLVQISKLIEMNQHRRFDLIESLKNYPGVSFAIKEK